MATDAPTCLEFFLKLDLSQEEEDEEEEDGYGCTNMLEDKFWLKIYKWLKQFGSRHFASPLSGKICLVHSRVQNLKLAQEPGFVASKL